jgi:hypothetical protein
VNKTCSEDPVKGDMLAVQRSLTAAAKFEAQLLIMFFV